jgi:hypothetical protein
MLKLSKTDFNEIRDWMYRNARNIELSLWKYHFENGRKEDVLSALAFYQNEDGGFGNILEADNWNPESTPYTTLRAIDILKSICLSDMKHPIMQGIFKYLESNRYATEYGWMFSIPSNDQYPHAPWWTYDSEANKFESIGITAELAAFILQFADSDSELYRRALRLSKQLTEDLKTLDKFGDMGIGGYCVLLETIKKCGLEKSLDYENILSIVKKLVYDSIERDISKWEFYGKRPSNFVRSPESVFFIENEDIVMKELDYLIEKRPEKSVWNITWSWFENNEKYAKEFAVSENWWKATVAIQNMTQLRRFGRM